MYPHPLDPEPNGKVVTLREQMLRKFSHSVRNKPNWTEKILDRELFTKWLKEAHTQEDKDLVTWQADDINFVYDELIKRYKPYVEELRAKGCPIEPDIDSVWRADGLIEDELRKELIDAVATLENVSEEEKDWHPGSNGQVLDLVHPSLWPVIYNRSVSLIDGQPIAPPTDCSNDADEYEEDSEDHGYRSSRRNNDDTRALNGYSDKFCWLPSEFEVGADGKTEVKSYINNLSTPAQKRRFYPIIEKIFSKFVPLFNHVLADMDCSRHWANRVSEPYIYDGDYGGEEIHYLDYDKYEEKWQELAEQFRKGERLTVDFWKEAVDAGKSRYDDDGAQVRDMGNPLTHRMWKPPVIGNAVRLEGKTVKVIVKMANIELTPENPSYSGGSWHVEAMKNERIIATGIYYYAQENITDSSLRFRRTCEMTNIDEDLHNSNWTLVYNMSDAWGESVQELGYVSTNNNRAIAFPNIYQHRVSGFRLADPKKPGYRKILVFFLCDPDESLDIPTTRIVAPQQDAATAEYQQVLREGPMGQMPLEVFDLVLKNLPPPITLEEAKKYREELMKERSVFTRNSKKVQGRSYSLCEH
ncbi:hypothetical protein TWF696_000937 [Orbilia brochopaga]|uniref:Uncharacterized protein n=1 Tax=Orbilia brochopaga TaxID=3140254 RepID=A0AAV9VJ55_9PEZI